MSRITFGYTINEKSLGDLFGKEIEHTKIFLDHIKNTSNTEISAWFSNFEEILALRAKFEGELNSLEKALDIIIDKEGLPTFLVKPVVPYRIFPEIQTYFFGSRDFTPTTRDAFDLMKDRYKKEKTRLINLDNGTVVNAAYCV